jgi:3-isopropylmalate/(R)-2-methylmalate dehydratase small subunit
MAVITCTGVGGMIESASRDPFFEFDILRVDVARWLDIGQPGMDNAKRPLNPDFVLNQARYKGAEILLARKNFGCGSSREHAPWALLDFGIRCVISTSFGDIFYNNCFKNGVLPIKVSPEDLEKLFDDAERGANATLSIDLASQEIRGPDGGMVKFDIDPHRKHCLLNGLDDIGMTMVKERKIEDYEAKAKAARPWA